MKTKRSLLILSALFAFSLACQAVTGPISNPTEQPTSVPTPSPVPTLEPITEKSLAGLLIVSPVLGMAPGPYMGDYPIKGLGIVNQEGQLVKFTDAGLLKGYSPAASYIVYQYYSIEKDANDRLRAFDAASGQTVIFENELRGEKSILGWLDASPSKFVFENDLASYLFEAYGYFEGREILLADASTGEVTLLLEHTFQSDLSPDSSKLAYTTGELNQIPNEHMQEGAGCFKPQIFDIATSTSSAFDTSQLTDQPLCLGLPTWSSDGKWIAWIGYFSDDNFRAVVFETSTGTGTVYDPLDLYVSGQSASWWNIDLEWADDVTFRTKGYQVNVITGKVTASDWETTFPVDNVRPDGLISAELEYGTLTVHDKQGNLLTTFSLDELYLGESNDYGFDGTEFMVTMIAGWLPFAPAGGIP